MLLPAIVCTSSAIASLDYVNVPPESVAIVDVRDRESCLQRSLSSAVCIPLEDLFATNERLANFSGVLWLLGTAGLDGNEHVLVVGDNQRRKNILGGLLYLAGQRTVSILLPSLQSLPDDTIQWGRGRGRANLRQSVFQAAMRSNNLILPGELAERIRQGQAMTVLDGRSEAAYWGGVNKLPRGGHLPGADHYPLPENVDELNAELAAPFPSPTYVYAHDTALSLAYFTQLTARGLDAVVLLGGWQAWAIDGSLPVDAASYMSASRPQDLQQIPSGRARSTPIGLRAWSGSMVSVGVVLTLCAVLCLGWILGRRVRS